MGKAHLSHQPVKGDRLEGRDHHQASAIRDRVGGAEDLAERLSSRGDDGSNVDDGVAHRTGRLETNLVLSGAGSARRIPAADATFDRMVSTRLTVKRTRAATTSTPIQEPAW